jgi:hypothetical protein
VRFRVRRDVERMRLAPGDIVIVTPNRFLDRHELKRVREQLEREFPDNRCVVVADGWKLSVVSPASALSAGEARP